MMSEEGMILTMLATELAEAVAKDQLPENGGCDIAAGIYGPCAAKWLRGLAKELASKQEGNNGN